LRQPSGEIGTLFQDGKQLGGFLNWAIDLKLNAIERPGGREYKKVLTKATASKHWLLEKPTEGEITAHYYLLVGDTLALVNSHIVQVELTGPVNKMLGPLEMIWTN
jgi:hypothetical protein